MTEEQLQKIARDKSAAWTKRAAAERMLRTLEHGDIADFAALLRGEQTIEDLRGMGINTEVVKKLRTKSRKVKGEDGAIEEIIEREIELHDRAGHDFDRVVNQTAGNPVQPVEAEVNLHDKSWVWKDVADWTPQERQAAEEEVRTLRQVDALLRQAELDEKEELAQNEPPSS